MSFININTYRGRCYRQHPRPTHLIFWQLGNLNDEMRNVGETDQNMEKFKIIE